MDLTDKTALVTGASGGIGAEFARRLADHGAHLVLVARSTDKLERLRTELREAHPGRTIDVIVADLSEPGAGERITSTLSRPIDLLVNNAGVGSHGAFAEMAPDALARQIQLNCGSLVDLTARLLPAMLARDTGGVINIASTAAYQPLSTMAVYAAGKAFVLSFTEALWAETRNTGVRVLTVCPGATETGFFAATGKEFLTSNRHTPAEVVRTALAAYDGHSPTVIPGLANKIISVSGRFVPRPLMARMSRRFVQPAT